MELTSDFSLFDEISHLFVKKRKGKTRALLHNVENGLGVASFRQKENAQVTWVWSSWCTRTDLVLGCSPKQAIPDSIFPLETHFFSPGMGFPQRTALGEASHTLCSPKHHTLIFSRALTPPPQKFLLLQGPKEGDRDTHFQRAAPSQGCFCTQRDKRYLNPFVSPRTPDLHSSQPRPFSSHPAAFKTSNRNLRRC